MAAQLPSLSQSLRDRDPGHLRIVAELWGLELNAPDDRSSLKQLASLLLNRRLVVEVVELLPGEARLAVDELVRSGGRLPWALFTRRHGEVREVGPGRRDRERLYLDPSSPAEVLWYRAFVARDFFDSPAGLEEFAYIPADLLALIPAPQGEIFPTLGRAASPAERSRLLPANDRILDHASTLLAALRLGFPTKSMDALWESGAVPQNPFPLSPDPLVLLLSTAGLLDEAGIPRPEPTREFLEAGRGEALAILARAWLHSSSFNELRLLPGRSAEGEWQNDPLQARQAVLGLLSAAPGGRDEPAGRPFVNLASFVAAVRQAHPDFQRPAGDYDSWFIRDERSGEFLRGFVHWDQVDGALIRYLICGPLHWLGVLDLAAPAAEGPVTAFRFSEWAPSLLRGQAPQGLAAEQDELKISSDARLRVPRLAPRSVRYQIARFAIWEGEQDGVYQYRLTPASLERARQQGLRLNHLLALLRRHAATVPPALGKALARWEEYGVEARLERVMVLRLSSPELLQTLRASRAARFLSDPLGPTAVIVAPGAWKKVLAVLSEMGYLGEAEFTEE